MKKFSAHPPFSFTRVRFFSSFSQIPFPRSSVILCDRKAPRELQRFFPKAIFVTAGENLKTLSSIEKLAQKVLQKNSDRSMTLIDVGGGSLGDATGFLASILWRGIGLVHVPTTLLSMIDSAHGGKTAVNLPGAKNQLGTFYPAKEVWILPSILTSLPKPLLQDGWVEMIKTLLIGDSPSLHPLLNEKFKLIPPPVTLMKKVISIKQDLCKKDLFETKGLRESLNLGHSLGHALEINTNLSHGQSVAWGLCVAGWISQRFGFSDFERLFQWMKPLLQPPKFWPSQKTLEKSLRFDKKQKNQQFRSIVLSKIGSPIVTHEVSAQEWIQELYEIQKKI